MKEKGIKYFKIATGGREWKSLLEWETMAVWRKMKVEDVK